MRKTLISARLALGAAIVVGASSLTATHAEAVPVEAEVVSVSRTPSESVRPAGLFLCNFLQYGDWVHISSTAPRAASGHGWWENVDCDAVLADVTVQLQIYKGGSWKNVGSAGRKRVYSGGGSANRAAARVTCANSNSYKWRSVIDVDVVGVADAANKLTTGEKTLACYA